MRQEYLLAAVLIDPRELKAARGALRAMLLPAEHRLHFSKEHDGRRRDLLAQFCAHGFRVTVYVTARGHAARERLLHALGADTRDDLRRLVIESRGVGDVEDRRLLVLASSALGTSPTGAPTSTLPPAKSRCSGWQTAWPGPGDQEEIGDDGPLAATSVAASADIPNLAVCSV